MAPRSNATGTEAVVSRLIDSAEMKLRLCEQAESIAVAAGVWIEALRKGKKILICGNGGSAADSQHIAAELVSRFARDREALAAMALTVDTSVLTACGNDYGFEEVFARQVAALGRPGDVLVAISTSGSSKNVLRAVHEASRRRLITVALCGLGGQLASMADHVIAVPSRETPRIQEAHITIGHVICGIVEEAMFGPPDPEGKIAPISLPTEATA